MNKKELELKYRTAGLPSGQIDTVSAVANAHGVLVRKNLTIENIIEGSLGRVHTDRILHPLFKS